MGIEQVHVDQESRELVVAIERITDGGEFSAVLTALEATMARRLKREAGGDLGPAWTIVTGQMVARHMMALLDAEGLTDAFA